MERGRRYKLIKMTFAEPEIAICGNGVVEEGEECDCGWEEVSWDWLQRGSRFEHWDGGPQAAYSYK